MAIKSVTIKNKSPMLIYRNRTGIKSSITNLFGTESETESDISGDIPDDAVIITPETEQEILSHYPEGARLTPSGRVIYVQNADIENNIGYGVVLCSKVNGKSRKILIPRFGMYQKYWSKTEGMVDGLYPFEAKSTDNTSLVSDGILYIYRYKDENNVPQHKLNEPISLSNEKICSGKVFPTLGPVTDNQLDEWLRPICEKETKTAHELTDLIIKKFGSSAELANYYRSLGYDLPLLRDLITILVECDYIQEISNGGIDISYNLSSNPNVQRLQGGTNICSCQQVKYTNTSYPSHVLGINAQSGMINGLMQTYKYNTTIPILELE